MAPEKETDLNARETTDDLKSEVDRLKKELESTKEELALKKFLISYFGEKKEIKSTSEWIDEQLKQKESGLRKSLKAEILNERANQSAPRPSENLLRMEIHKRASEYASQIVAKKSAEIASEREALRKEAKDLADSFESDRRLLEHKHELAMGKVDALEKELIDGRAALARSWSELEERREQLRFEIDERVGDEATSIRRDYESSQTRLWKNYEKEQTRLLRRENNFQKKIATLENKNLDLKSQVKTLKSITPSERELRRANDALRKEVKALEIKVVKSVASSHRALKRSNKTLQEKLDQALNRQAFGADLERLMDWLRVTRPPDSSPFGEDLITFGCGPFEVEEFDHYVRSIGITPYFPDPSINEVAYIVVGQRDWEEHLNLVVNSEFDEGPYVLTQELFLASYFLKENPFAPENEDLLLSLSRGHPAIEYLESIGFDWRCRLGETVEEPEEEASLEDAFGYPINYSNWDFLPPGQWDMATIESHFEENRATIEAQLGQVVDINRLYEIDTLKPSMAIVGRKGWLGYITFSFDFTDKVVLECPVEGNAVYILNRKDWPRLVKKTKADVRKSRSFWKKVVHKNEWLERVQNHLLSK